MINLDLWHGQRKIFSEGALKDSRNRFKEQSYMIEHREQESKNMSACISRI